MSEGLYGILIMGQGREVIFKPIHSLHLPSGGVLLRDKCESREELKKYLIKKVMSISPKDPRNRK